MNGIGSGTAAPLGPQWPAQPGPDGRAWTVVEPTAPPHGWSGQLPAAVGPSDPRRRVRRGDGMRWLLLAKFVLGSVLAVGALLAGRGIAITFGDAGFTVTLQEPEGQLAPEVQPERVQEAQQELQEVVAEARQEIATRPSAPVAQFADLNGVWVNPFGGRYDIVQDGGGAVITEHDALGNITAVGEGTISAGTFSFDYTTAAYTTGSGSLTLSPDGSRLDGFFTDLFGSRPAQLTRAS